MTPLLTSNPSQANAAQTDSSGTGARRFSPGPVLIAAAVYTLITLTILLAGWRLSDHHFVYPLDDTYIGMAMAKNLAFHGVWGVSRDGFTSSDSSLLMPVLLAVADRLIGAREMTALLLSWIAGLASLFVAGRILAGFLERKGQTIALLLLTLLAPVFVAGVLGMEHSLHLLFTLLFLGYFLEADAGAARRERLWFLGVMTALMVASRYEGLFFVAPVFCVLVWERRWKAGLAMAVAAAAPVAAYAAYSLAHGGYWLPNSVALKGVQLHDASVLQPLYDILRCLAQNYADMGLQLFLLVASVGVAALVVAQRSCRLATPLLIVFLAGVQHLCLARIGVLFRYESYLVAAAVLALACAWPCFARSDRGLLRAGAMVLLLATGALLSVRSVAAALALPACSRNIYLQQWQMARFLGASFPHASVAANDIGAINYYNDLHCFDLVGLANADVFRARRADRYTTAFLSQETGADHVQIAILYDAWFATPPPGLYGGPALPSTWIRVGRWRIPNHAVLGEDTVSFYAVDPAEAEPLRMALRRFDPSLPSGVTASMQ